MERFRGSGYPDNAPELEKSECRSGSDTYSGGQAQGYRWFILVSEKRGIADIVVNTKYINSILNQPESVTAYVLIYLDAALGIGKTGERIPVARRLEEDAGNGFGGGAPASSGWYAASNR